MFHKAEQKEKKIDFKYQLIFHSMSKDELPGQIVYWLKFTSLSPQGTQQLNPRKWLANSENIGDVFPNHIRPKQNKLRLIIKQCKLICEKRRIFLKLIHVSLNFLKKLLYCLFLSTLTKLTFLEFCSTFLDVKVEL